MSVHKVYVSEFSLYTYQMFILIERWFPVFIWNVGTYTYTCMLFLYYSLIQNKQVGTDPALKR